MTAPNTTTALQPRSQGFSIRPASVLYEVKSTGRKTHTVTVNRSPAGMIEYTCTCGMVELYGECQHSQAVQAERRAQGRK
jgi:hypothetical protein